MLTGASNAVVRLYGPDLTVLREKAHDVEDALKGINGVADLHVELMIEEPQVEIKVDLPTAKHYRLKPGDVLRAAATFVNGVEVGDIFWGGKVYDVNVLGTAATRHSVTSLQELLIDTPDGGHVRLDDVATVHIVPVPNVINRQGGSRRIDVGLSVRGRDLGSVARDVEQHLKTVDFPLEYHPELLGEYVERQAAEQRLQGFAMAVVIMIFFLLLAAFGDERLTLLSFVTLPSALVGGVLGSFIGDGIISLGSLVGFFTILGIAARNVIIMINHFQHLERYEGETFGPALVLRGAKELLSPILMTALATDLAVVPLVISGTLPGHEIEHPMAVVILGGLVTSTLLNLFVLPSRYLRFGKGSVQSAQAVS